MKSISLKHVTVDFGKRVVLEDVSLTINEGERVSVVGENGGGKSTLMRVMMGEIEASEGEVHITKGLRTFYVSQEFPKEALGQTVLEYFTETAGHTLIGKAKEFASLLGMKSAVFEKRCKELSGGQQKIIQISVGLAQNPDFLLLDEPENHLDIVTRRALLTALKGFRNGLVIISHDRAVIDTLTRRVVAVELGHVYISDGGYAGYKKARALRVESAQRDFDEEVKRIDKLEKALVIAHQKAIRGKETAAYHKIKDEITALKQKHKVEKRATDEFTAIRIKDSTSNLHAQKRILAVKDVSFGFRPGSPLFKNLSFEIYRGPHVVILGRNGSGKSTLLSLLSGVRAPQSGVAEWSPGLSVRYLEQHTTFDEKLSAREVVENHFHVFAEAARRILGSVKFDTDRMDRPLASLSGGERMRLKFALVFGENPDVIILDEPTNHIDITTWDILLEQCNETRATILLVTHDEEFIRELKHKRFYVLSKQTLVERHKTLDELLDELATH